MYVVEYIESGALKKKVFNNFSGCREFVRKHRRSRDIILINYPIEVLMV